MLQKVCELKLLSLRFVVVIEDPLHSSDLNNWNPSTKAGHNNNLLMDKSVADFAFQVENKSAGICHSWCCDI